MLNSARRALFASSLFSLFVLVAFAASAAAQTYPTRPVTVVVPSAPGSQPDQMARLIARKLEARLGQPFVVENRAGAGGNLGGAYIVQSPADGYRILFTSQSLAVFNPIVYRKMPYSEDDLATISITYRAPVVLGVPGVSDTKTFKELVDKIKANPSAHTFGTAGIGSMGHIAGAMLLKLVDAAGVVHVPYRGTAAVLPDMLAGRLTFGFDAPGTYKPHLESGGVRGMLVTSSKRMKSFPDIPTIDEVGLAEFQARTWFGWRIRAGTPRAIIDTLAAALIEINKDPDILRELAATEAEAFENSTHDSAEAFLAAERKRWEPYVRASGASVE